MNLLKPYLKPCRARIQFLEGVENYADEDKALQGSTIFHLASRFDAACLNILVQFLKFKNQTQLLLEHIVTRSENSIAYTPLHIAARHLDPTPLR